MLRFAGRPLRFDFGLADAASDMALAQSAIAQYATLVANGDAQVQGQVFDLAVSSYRAAGLYATLTVIPELSAAAADVGVTSGPLASSFAAALQFVALDNAALQALNFSTDPANPIATLDTALDAQKLAYAIRDQLTAMAGTIQATPAPSAPAAPPAPVARPFAWKTAGLFAASIAAAMVLDRTVLSRRPSHA